MHTSSGMENNLADGGTEKNAADGTENNAADGREKNLRRRARRLC